MKIEYVSHACLLIDTGDLKIVTDPWFVGSAFNGQWNVFPKPVRTDFTSEVDVILLSHGHDDHCHPPTLERFTKSARVFYPFNWYGGVKLFLGELGFKDVTEAPTHKTLQLSPKTSITYIVNNLDSMIVIESDGTVFVNVNDALHSYPQKIIDVFVETIRARWPRIDTVFCGFGGASYFPNTVHCVGKNDREIGAVREQMFVQSFCRIVDGLDPRVAVPFAADFALIRPVQRWINQARFPRVRMPDYYREFHGNGPNSPTIHPMFPGDVLNDNRLEPLSPYRAELRNGDLNHLIDQQYQPEIAALENEPVLPESEALILQNEILENVTVRAKQYPEKHIRQIAFSVRISDLVERPIFNISTRGSEPQIERSDAIDPDSILELQVSSSNLRYSFASEWGGDVLTVGYGCEIQIFQPEIIKQQLDVFCVQLLTRTPSASRHWKEEPIRMVRYIASSPVNRSWASHALLLKIKGQAPPFTANEQDYKMRTWLQRTKCEVCQACDLPMLDEGFAQTL